MVITGGFFVSEGVEVEVPTEGAGWKNLSPGKKKPKTYIVTSAPAKNDKNKRVIFFIRIVKN